MVKKMEKPCISTNANMAWCGATANPVFLGIGAGTALPATLSAAVCNLPAFAAAKGGSFAL
jgi:hypothetical protein